MNYADAAAATAVLVNAAPQASLDASLVAAGEPVMDAERGFAAFTLTLKSALGTMTEDSYTLRVSDLPDTAEGEGQAFRRRRRGLRRDGSDRRGARQREPG